MAVYADDCFICYLTLKICEFGYLIVLFLLFFFYCYFVVFFYLFFSFVLIRTTNVETQPFKQLAADGSLRGYSHTWAHFLSFVITCINMDDTVRRFSLTQHQRISILKLKEALCDGHSTSETRQMQIQATSYTLLAHTLGKQQGTETHPLITFVIISNINPGNIFASPENVSPFLSRIQYGIRTILFLQMHNLVDPSPEGLSLFQAMEMEVKWLKEGQDTIFSWLRQMIHLCATFAHSAIRMPKFVWGLDDGVTFSYSGYKIKYKAVTEMISQSVIEVQAAFSKVWEMLCLPKEWFVEDTSFADRLADRSAEYFFGKLENLLNERSQDVINHVLNSGEFCSVIGGQIIWFPAQINKLLNAIEDFNTVLAYALYLTGGQPPRGTELMATLWKNLTTRIRNMYLINGFIVNVGFLNKTTFNQNEDKPIPRAYPKSLTHILINYLSFIRPIEHILYLESPKANLVTAPRLLTHLFATRGKMLTTSTLTAQLKLHTIKYLKCSDGFGTADMRQILIFVGMRYITPKIETEQQSSLMDLQAGHSSEIARRWYGVEFERFSTDISEEMLRAFMNISFLHHGEFGVGASYHVSL